MRLISVWYQDYYPFDLLFPNHQRAHCGEVDHSTLTKDDVILIWGGIDVDPATYGHKNVASDMGGMQRDNHELLWINAAKAAGAICIGICRGLQLLTVANGGWLIQHINGHAVGDYAHMVLTTTHPVAEFLVNSYHHQTIVFGTGDHECKILATAAMVHPYFEYDLSVDRAPQPFTRIIEAAVWSSHRQIGVQWHPEWMHSHSEATEWLFKEIKKL